MTQVHTQLIVNYKYIKLSLLKPEVLKYMLGSHDRNYVHGKCRA